MIKTVPRKVPQTKVYVQIYIVNMFIQQSFVLSAN